MDDKARIEQWFTTYGSDIHHFLVYYTGRSQAEDLVQEVFVKALKGSRKYQGRANPKTWLISIARRVAIDEYRKRRADFISSKQRNMCSRMASFRLPNIPAA